MQMAKHAGLAFQRQAIQQGSAAQLIILIEQFLQNLGDIRRTQFGQLGVQLP